MTPGLAGGPPFPTRAIKNAVVAIASVQSPSVPKVVGVCEIDVSSLEQVAGAKGHAVRSEHWEGDEAWSWSSNDRPGAPSPERIKEWISEDGGKTMIQAVGGLALEDDEEDDDQGGVSLGRKSDIAQKTKPSSEEVEGKEAENNEEEDLSTKGKSGPVEYNFKR